jgi:RNA polymerase sigma-70 factor, ECF subfamily
MHAATVHFTEPPPRWDAIAAALRDPRAFQPLYEQHHQAIYRYVWRRVADDALAADLTQDVFVKALTALRTYDPRKSAFGAWLYGIALNEVRMHYRKHPTDRVLRLDDDRLNRLADELAPDSVPDLDELVQQLTNAMGQLGSPDRELVELKYFEGCTHEQAAQALGLTVANSKVRLHRALHKLRALFTLSNA